MVNFNLDFKAFGKNMEVLGFKTENKNKLKCKIEPPEVLGHSFRVLRKPTCPRVFFSTRWGG